MQPVNIGMLVGAARHVPVILGGGTQMAPVMAAAVKLDPSIVGNFMEGTTRWLLSDPNSDLVKLVGSISPKIPIVNINMDYSKSPYEGLQAYEWGYIKEGVGCGASSVAAVAGSAWKIDCDALLARVHEIYRKIINADRRT